MKKLVRDQLKVITGGLACNPGAGIDCPGKSKCCALSFDSPSGICRASTYEGACWAPNP
ncbi:Bacteriocin [Elizabethkingia bruuniana]